MVWTKAEIIVLSEKQANILGELQSGRSKATYLKRRSEIIMLAADGESTNAISKTLGISRYQVRHWRNKFNDASEYEGLDIMDLGIKGKHGILKDKKSRRTFLEKTEHRIRFLYTPKHCSWLNQIECWFSIITRSLLNSRLSSTSIDNLESKIHKFINFYNEFWKKPFDWSKPQNFLRFDKYFKETTQYSDW